MAPDFWRDDPRLWWADGVVIYPSIVYVYRSGSYKIKADHLD